MKRTKADRKKRKNKCKHRGFITANEPINEELTMSMFWLQKLLSERNA